MSLDTPTSMSLDIAPTSTASDASEVIANGTTTNEGEAAHDSSTTNEGEVATDESATTTTVEPATQNEASTPAEVTEEDKYWKNVHENSTDFSSWTYLVQIIEKQGDIEKIRKVYDEFLVYFPLCFFYWKKYADHEANKGNVEKALSVYERGVHGIQHSVDLWTYYCSFVSDKSGDVEQSRNMWERAAATIGTDFAAHTFWDKYIDFETAQEAFPRVIALYLRILQTPLEQLPQYHSRFKTFVNSRPLSELLLPKEVTELEEEKKKQEEKYNALTAKKEEGEAIEPSEIESAGIKTGDEVEVEFRTQVMANREELFKKTLEDVTKRRTFEHGVGKRPYFHVKPLDDVMVSNWRKYLEFEERESTAANPSRVVKLYERCLVAACYYSEFWMRYIKWLEGHKSVEDTRSAFVRATTIFLLRRADIHIEYALFEEVHGDIAKARLIYENLASTLPGHVESTVRFVSFERRQKRNTEACDIFETALTISSTDAKAGPFLSMQYGLFLDRVVQDPAKVRDMYDRALQKFPENKDLWMAYIQFESSHNEPDKVLALYARVVAEDSKVTPDERIELWHMYLEYAADWVSNPASIRKLTETFRTLFPTCSYKAENATRKRTYDSTSTHANDTQASTPTPTPTPTKVPRTNSHSAASANNQAAAQAAAAAAQAAYTAQAQQAQAASQYNYPYGAQYAGYSYPTTAAGYAYPYTHTGTAQAAATTPQAAYSANAGGYSYAYPYGYTQPT